MVPKPQNAKPPILEIARALNFAESRVGMLTTIDFDHQLPLAANEIHDVGFNCLLAAKSQSLNLVTA